MEYKDIKFSNDTSFLITGGAGFIGSNLCEFLLDKGYRVRCLDNFSTGKKENIEEFFKNRKFDFLEGDIRDLNVCIKSCEGIDYVFHQAAWGSVPRSIKMPILYEEINIRGTLNMMEAAKLSNVRRFIYASSSSVYGDHKTLPKKEGIEGNLLSPYALTKKVNEEYAKLYTTLYGLETVGLRYFNVFGRKQNPNSIYAAVIPIFIKTLLQNKAPNIFGDGSQSRDFTYVDNVIEANFRACIAPKEATGEVYNIAYGGRESLIEVYTKISKVLGKNIEPVWQDERIGDIKHSNADISKAMKYLGYNPKYNFSEGIELVIEWYKKFQK